MREEMDNKFEAILREIKTNKNASTVTNPRSETNEIQDSQPSKSIGSKTKSIGVHASNNENSDSENDDYLLRASKMNLKHPASPFFQNKSYVDILIHSNEESEKEDYHNLISKFSRILSYCTSTNYFDLRSDKKQDEKIASRRPT